MTTICGYELHTAANMIPMATPTQQEAIENSIKRGGQALPITLFNNQIVDGRSRALACEALGIKVKTRSLKSELTEADILEYVMSMNVRRSLSDADALKLLE